MADQASSPAESRGALKIIGSLILLLALVVGAAWLFDLFLMPSSTPVFAHPTAIDSLMDSRFIVGVIRLIGVLIALYVVTSMIMLVKEGRWLTGVGGLSTEKLKNDRKRLQRQLKEADTRYATLGSAYNDVIELLSKVVESVPDSDNDQGGAP